MEGLIEEAVLKHIRKREEDYVRQPGGEMTSVWPEVIWSRKVPVLEKRVEGKEEGSLEMCSVR